jgi:rRNA maturation endonuclease Nob1
MTLPLRKVDPKKKGKLPTLCPTFCPICGKNLEHKTKSRKESP